MSGTIGGINFDILIGEVPTLTPEIEILEKPGEDGFVRRDLGIRSPPFQLTSLGGFSSLQSAENAFDVYHRMKGLEPQIFVKDGFSYTAGGIGTPPKYYKVAVIEVTKSELRRVACSTFGVTQNWLLRVNWTLRLTPTTPTP